MNRLSIQKILLFIHRTRVAYAQKGGANQVVTEQGSQRSKSHCPRFRHTHLLLCFLLCRHLLTYMQLLHPSETLHRTCLSLISLKSDRPTTEQTILWRHLSFLREQNAVSVLALAYILLSASYNPASVCTFHFVLVLITIQNLSKRNKDTSPLVRWCLLHSTISTIE